MAKINNNNNKKMKIQFSDKDMKENSRLWYCQNKNKDDK